MMVLGDHIKRLLVTTAFAAILAAGSSQAAPVTFFGEDGNPTGNVPIAHPNSDAAQTNFLSNLTGVGVENFDGFASGLGTVPVNFGNGVTATLSGGSILNSPGSGRFAISSPNFYEADTSSFTINFSAPISAFGFYGTDIGDFGGQLGLVMTRSGGGTTNLVVPNLIGSGGSQPEDGSVLYYGFYDLGASYTSISFTNSNTSDVFGFDNFTVGTLQQITPSVPEPGTWAMMLLGFAGLGFAGYRRARKEAATM